MRFNHLTAMILIGTLHLILPLALILWTWMRNYTCALALILQLLVLMAYTVFIFLMGSWVFASFFLRYGLLIFTLAVTIRTLFHLREMPIFLPQHTMGWIGSSLGIVIVIVLCYLIVGAFRSHFYDEKPINLAFPLKNGTYAVFEGGNGKVNALMNYHYGATMHQGAHTNLSMRYAVDITKLTRMGNDANGYLPMQNNKYAVFNQTLYCPCDGEVMDVEDKWENETPWSGNPPYNVGNHVLITTDDFGVLMGHIQKGSILVQKGDKVKKGQPIAQVGNSGWTSQPHLHIQAMRRSTGSFWGWEGLPILFEGRNPIKNSLFFQH